MRGHFVSASFWWPGDRAWTVVTEIDSHSRYIGADAETIDLILGSADVEAIEVSRDVKIS